jgi:hypothetical protein
MESHTNPEDVVNGDMLGDCHHERDLRLNGLFNGLCCLVTRNIDSRCIRLCFVLSLIAELRISSPSHAQDKNPAYRFD